VIVAITPADHRIGPMVPVPGVGTFNVCISRGSGRMSCMSVAIVMGSASDATIMDDAVQILRSFGVKVEVRVISAHRTPDDAIDFARNAESNGIKVIIAAAGGAAHLAGVLAAATSVPVIGVPVALANLGGLDSLLAMVQMPKGVPVAVVAVNGARNAGLLAVRIMALSDERLAVEQARFVKELAEAVRDQDAEIVARYNN
jgi:5-(carboxyamino)imidazole ribonucleotide mutase